MIRQPILPLLLVVGCLSQPAFAQINPFYDSRAMPLDADDIAAQTAAINRLLDRPQLVPGVTEAWNNPKSGAGGTVTAGNAVQRHGLPCRVVRYRTIMPDSPRERSVTLAWCKTVDGWKIG